MEDLQDNQICKTKNSYWERFTEIVAGKVQVA